MSEYQNNHEIGWDDEIVSDGESYIVLDEGDYNFTVTTFERGRFPGGAKIPPCNKAILTLAVETPEGTARTTYDLIMWTSLEWKIAAFFRAIGQKKHGESFMPRWGEVIGSKGRARFKPRTYPKKDGTEGTTNDVDKFYDYDPAFFTEGQSWVAEAASAPEVSTPKWQAGKF